MWQRNMRVLAGGSGPGEDRRGERERCGAGGRECEALDEPAAAADGLGEQGLELLVRLLTPNGGKLRAAKRLITRTKRRRSRARPPAL